LSAGAANVNVLQTNRRAGDRLGAELATVTGDQGTQLFAVAAAGDVGHARVVRLETP
jgi:hypothetical protein